MGAVQLSANRRNGNLRLYEFGNCYFYDEAACVRKSRPVGLLRQYRLAIAVTGAAVPQSWNAKPGVVVLHVALPWQRNLLHRFGLDIYALKCEPRKATLFDDRRATAGKLLQMGVVAPRIRRAFDLKQRSLFGMEDFDALEITRKHRIAFGVIEIPGGEARPWRCWSTRQVTPSHRCAPLHGRRRKLLRKRLAVRVQRRRQELPEGKNLCVEFRVGGTNVDRQGHRRRLTDNLQAQFERQAGRRRRAGSTGQGKNRCGNSSRTDFSIPGLRSGEQAGHFYRSSCGFLPERFLFVGRRDREHCAPCPAAASSIAVKRRMNLRWCVRVRLRDRLRRRADGDQRERRGRNSPPSIAS